MVKAVLSVASGPDRQSLGRGHRVLGKRRWDDAIQETVEACCETGSATVDHCASRNMDPKLVQRLLQRSAKADLPLAQMRFFLPPGVSELIHTSVRPVVHAGCKSWAVEGGGRGSGPFEECGAAGLRILRKGERVALHGTAWRSRAV